MSRLSSALCFCGLLLALPAAAGEWLPLALPAAQQLDLRSATTGHDYRIFLSLPAAPPPAAGYPVLYVLDGNAAFPVAAFLARNAASRREVTGHLPTLVVGIGYPGDADFDVAARRRDYTVGAGAAAPAATEGGAERFLDFIDRELKPLLAARHAIDATRQALFGHSFGGLFVLHALLTRPSSFSTYLASSPSIWWDDKRVLDSVPQLAHRAAGLPPRVQISVGALEGEPPQGRQRPATVPTRSDRAMVTEARSLAARLQDIPGWRDRVVYHELEGEDHGAAWLPAMSRGLTFFLSGH